MVAIDNLSCGDRVRISALEESSDFKFYEGDICEASTVENIFLKEMPLNFVIQKLSNLNQEILEIFHKKILFFVSKLFRVK